MAAYDVTVTWMDGKQETYYASDYPRIMDGDLHIVERFGVSGGIKEDRRIPQANIRIWKAEQR